MKRILIAVCLSAILPAVLLAREATRWPPGETAKLVAVLTSDADVFDMAKACQRLSIVGDEIAVPALAGLLADEQFASYARNALEGILDPANVDMGRRTEELQQLRFGMFICWSFSTFSGKEWTRDIEGVDFFKATGCDTDQWCRTAKEAGMGYILEANEVPTILEFKLWSKD